MHCVLVSDKIISRQETEYTRLKSILTATQNDFSKMMDLNEQYLIIINTYNQMQQSGNSRNNDEEVQEKEVKLREYEETIKELTIDLDDIANDITNKQNDLDKLYRREKKYKALLGLDMNAGNEEVEAQIEKLLSQGQKHEEELDKIRRELKTVTHNKDGLQERLNILSKDKDKIEFHMRQQELSMRKMKRLKMGGNTLNRANAILATRASPAMGEYERAIKLPSIERDGSQIGLASKQGISGSGMQYCVFCHVEVQPMKSQCRLHYKPIRQGKWMCCKDNCHHGAGCITVPHLYIVVTIEKKILITDGVRYMDLT